MGSAWGVSATTSKSALASTTSTWPLTAHIVQRVEHLLARDAGGPTTRALQPFIDGGTAGETSGLPPQEIGDRQTRLRGARREGRVDLIIDVAYLHRLRHRRIISSAFA